MTSAPLHDWQTAEYLADLLTHPADLPSTLAQVLHVVLNALNRESAALFVKPLADGASPFWIPHHIPLSLQPQLENLASPLSFFAQDLLKHPGIRPAGHSLEVDEAFPVSFGDETLAVLLLWGGPLTAEDRSRCQALLRPVGRALYTHKLRQTISNDGHTLPALQALIHAYTTAHDPHLLQRQYLQSLQMIFQAREALLFLLDDHNPRLVIQKHLDPNGNWEERATLDMGHAFIVPSGQEPQAPEAATPSADQIISWLSTSMGSPIQNIVSSLLISNRSPVGMAVLVDPQLDDSDPYRRSLLQLTSSLLAHAIVSQRQLLNLKITIADLEASRWEIIHSRNTLRTFFDSIPTSVYIIDRNYVLISVNLKRSQRVGRHPSELVGRKCYEQFYHRMDPCPGCRAMETFASAVITSRYAREWYDQERFVEWEITTFPIQEHTNLPHQVILFEEDVTEKRTLEASLIQAEKLSAVGQLAAGVAHEINNPLSAIIANSQMLLRDIPSTDRDLVESLKLIETAGVRASQVVTNLLGIARKEKKYEFELLDLNETIRGALSLVHHEVVQRAIEVKLDLQEDMPELMASRHHLQGVWINLIINGIDAIDHPDGQIKITSRYRDGEFRVMITDNGKGIPQEQLSKIFEPFFTTKAAGKGTGLGLSVCLRVIKEHRGNILVDSQPGVGTTFTILLPDRLPAGKN